MALTTRPRLLAALVVDQAATGGTLQPPARVRRDALARPVIGGGDERLLDGVLGRVEIARAVGKRAKDLRREGAEQVLDGGRVAQCPGPRAVSRKPSISTALDGPSSMIWRTMIGCWSARPPGPGTAETLAAISIARASEATSTIW